MQRSFLEICKSTGTDKVVKHNYHLRYPMFFELLRDKPIKMLEIGVAAGKSLRAWEEYFPNAQITGLDIQPRFKYTNTEKVFIYKGDQRNERLLIDIVKKRGPFDIIIDDGGHRMPPQQISFKVLFPTLVSGGWYVIEDTQTSYMRAFKGGYKHPRSTIEMLKESIDVLHAEHVQDIDLNDKYPLNKIDGIFFFEKIVFIRRKPEAALQPFEGAGVDHLLVQDEPDSTPEQ